MFHSILRLGGLVLLTAALGSCGAAEEVAFDFDGAIDNTTGLPQPWQPLKHPLEGWPSWTIIRDDALRTAIRGQSTGTSGGLMRAASQVDLKRTPWMHFSWKVDKHPRGTVAERSRSDQAMIIYIDFGKPKGGLFSRRRELAYIYDSTAKAGTWHDDSTMLATVWAKVVDSGDKNLGQWTSRAVNVAEDFQARFGSELEPIEGIAIYCNSNNSDSQSLGCCSRILFTESSVITSN